MNLMISMAIYSHYTVFCIQHRYEMAEVTDVSEGLAGYLFRNRGCKSVYMDL